MAVTTYFLVPGVNQDQTGHSITYDCQTPAWASTIAITATKHETFVQPLTTNGATTFTANVTTPNIGDNMVVSVVNDLVSPGSTFTIAFSTGFKMASGNSSFSITSTEAVKASFTFNGLHWVGAGFVTVA
jgi:hypothetical protein